MLLGIPVVKIQPGLFRTDMVASVERRFTEAAEASMRFRPVIERMRGLAAREQGKAHDPQTLAEVIHEAQTVARPKPAYPVRQDRQRLALDRLPTRWSDAILRRVLS